MIRRPGENLMEKNLKFWEYEETIMEFRYQKVCPLFDFRVTGEPKL